jgi:hypothetical protein
MVGKDWESWLVENFIAVFVVDTVQVGIGTIHSISSGVLSV